MEYALGVFWKGVLSSRRIIVRTKPEPRFVQNGMGLVLLLIRQQMCQYRPLLTLDKLRSFDIIQQPEWRSRFARYSNGRIGLAAITRHVINHHSHCVSVVIVLTVRICNGIAATRRWFS